MFDQVPNTPLQGATKTCSKVKKQNPDAFLELLLFIDSFFS